MPKKSEILKKDNINSGPLAPETSPTTTPAKNQNYQSNPFPLVFNALGRIFDRNVWWAIAIIALGLIGSFQYNYSADDNSTENFKQQVQNPPQLSNVSSDIFGIIAVASFIVIILVLLLTAISTFINGMFVYVALQTEKGRSSISFKEAVRETSSRFQRLFLANILAMIKIFLWSLLLIIPGIIAALRYALLSYVVMSEPSSNKGVSASHERVKSITKGRLIEVFGVLFASGIIPIIGEVLRIAGGATQYNQLVEFHDKHLTKPKVHWLNYLGLILLTLLLLLITLLVVFVVMAFYKNH